MAAATGVGRLLVDGGLLDDKRFEDLSRFAVDTSMTLKDALVQQGGLEEQAVLEAFAGALGVEFQGDLSKTPVPHEFIEEIPVAFAREHNCVAVGRHGAAFVIAASDPADIFALDNVALALGAPTLALLAPRGEVAALIDRAYHEKRGIVEEAMDDLGEEGLIDSAARVSRSEDVLDVARKPPIIRLVNLILSRALRQRASDVHLQPYEDRLQVRYRIDGILYDRIVIPKSVQEAVISRVKVMGRMDIAEKRLPQDGRASIKVADREVDLRISSVPIADGERIVLRLLDKGAHLYTLEELGLSKKDHKRFDKFVEFSHGIILVVGPTGSGKTTTLYAALQKLNSAERNIITIEDPIEYQLRGVSQIQTGGKGLTFAMGLRHVLRQDPDVIMVGEIRDSETASIAVQAALTGHLVFSTLHTNDAPGAITRLLDIGVEPYLVTSSVIAVMAQRLVRVICPHCRESYRPDPQVLAEIG
ncbi:MAG: Flp pilus assembly complex ATPase component TadA, partial [Planctomycetes bacterium]|nr:Flp pilus assembly complex ATPase component TadA [Planctomycetota bacterium]